MRRRSRPQKSKGEWRRRPLRALEKAVDSIEETSCECKCAALSYTRIHGINQAKNWLRFGTSAPSLESDPDVALQKNFCRGLRHNAVPFHCWIGLCLALQPNHDAA